MTHFTSSKSHKKKFWRDCSLIKIVITSLVVVIGICALAGIAFGIYIAVKPSNGEFSSLVFSFYIYLIFN